MSANVHTTILSQQQNDFQPSEDSLAVVSDNSFQVAFTGSDVELSSSQGIVESNNDGQTVSAADTTKLVSASDQVYYVIRIL